MPVTHIVKQGEYLSKIAAQYGFVSYKTIWEDAANAALRAKRKNNPNILFPGDQIVIPDREEKTESAGTDSLHKFEFRGDRLVLRLRVRDAEDQPIRNTPAVFTVEGDRREMVTNTDGQVERPIPRTADDGSLVVTNIEIPVKIGHLDPVDTISGQQARLNNLGYFAGPLDGSDALARRSAIEEFQCDHPPLRVDGDCGTKTQQKLKEVHGC